MRFSDAKQCLSRLHSSTTLRVRITILFVGEQRFLVHQEFVQIFTVGPGSTGWPRDFPGHEGSVRNDYGLRGGATDFGCCPRCAQPLGIRLCDSLYVYWWYAAASSRWGNFGGTGRQQRSVGPLGVRSDDDVRSAETAAVGKVAFQIVQGLFKDMP